MRLTEFQRLMDGEFGQSASWTADTHVVSGMGGTANELLDRGVDPREVWWGLCRDFDIPPERQLGADL